MLAGLPQFQEGKELYSLHLGMAQEAVNVFQKRRLADIATVEQVCHIETLLCKEMKADIGSHWLLD